MKLRYCRHCKEDVPMFNNQEFEQLKTMYSQCVRNIKQYRQTNGTTLQKTPLNRLYEPFAQQYKQLSGLPLQYDPSEVYQRHYLARWEAYADEAGK